MITRVRLLILTALLSVPFGLSAQTGRLQGRIFDAKTKFPLTGAHVRLTNREDTTETYLTISDVDGVFIFSKLGSTAYMLEATFLGREKINKTIRIENQNISIGDLLMHERAIRLGEVVIEGSPPPAIQKADTTEFNAGAFKTHPDATAEDLITKLPGITIDNGTVKAQGENVQQVLVDGKPFFGNDPTVALRNLPSDVIEKIQVFDKMSDQAEFTGFDDGQSIKTMNIVTRVNRRNQEFGKSYGGYGNDDRYLAGGSMNYFQSGTRLSLIGLSNNINQQNFSTQDLLGVVGNTNQRGGFAGGAGGGATARRGGGTGGGRGAGSSFGGTPGGGSGNTANFLVGQQNGVTTTNSIGSNYSDDWTANLKASQSYFFNNSNGENDQKLRREYFGTADSNTFYNENTNTNSKNNNHRFDMRLDYTVDSSNSIIEQPRLYFQNNRASNDLTGATTLSNGELINQVTNKNNSYTYGNTLSNHLVLRHKFETGRTLSVDLGAGYNDKRGTTDQQSYSEYFQTTGQLIDTINQQTPIITNGYNLSSRVAYTEPIGGISLLQLTYNPSFTKNRSDNKKYEFDPLTGEYSIPNLSLSNTYENEYTTQNAGIGYRLRVSTVNAMIGASYQIASLRSQREFPFSALITRKFNNVLPNAMLTYNMAEHTNLRIFYRTSTQAPSISQLQDVINNTNPLLLSTGNPKLNQSYNQSIAARYSETDVDRSRAFFLLFSVGYTNNYIGTSTTTANRDSVLSGGILFNRGTQLTIPVNLDNRWTANSFLTYSFVVDFIKSNLNLTSGLTFARTPGQINNDVNYTNTSGVSGGTVLSSNISEDVDFTLSYSGSYNISSNSIQPQLDSKYYYHTASAKVNLIFWEGVVFRSEMFNTLYHGLSGGFDQNFLLWNLNLGKKLFENQRGEIRLTVVDLLDQNKSINRTVTEAYLQDTENNVLGRYFMLTFTYTVR